MKEDYPTEFEVEIDRVGMRRFLMWSWLLLWCFLMAVLGATLGLARFEHAMNCDVHAMSEVPMLVVRYAAMGLGWGLLAGVAVYGLFNHRAVKRQAAALRVRVEGPFLRIASDGGVADVSSGRGGVPCGGFCDRKLHFRSIVDYAVVQTRLMRRLGVQSLRMTTTASGFNGVIVIPAVKDCLKVRDMLAEVDRAREQD